MKMSRLSVLELPSFRAPGAGGVGISGLRLSAIREFGRAGRWVGGAKRRMFFTQKETEKSVKSRRIFVFFFFFEVWLLRSQPSRRMLVTSSCQIIGFFSLTGPPPS